MTLKEFNTLNVNEQHEAVWSSLCIGFRTAGEYKVVVFKISDFYAEIYYDEKLNLMKQLKAMPTLMQDSMHKINPSTLYE